MEIESEQEVYRAGINDAERVDTRGRL